MNKSRTALAASALIVSVLLGGCDFEHPPGVKSGAEVDARLAGRWEQTNVREGKTAVYLTVERQSPSTLSVSDGTGFKLIAYRTDLPGSNVLQVEWLQEGWKRRYAVVVATLDGDRLRIRRVAKKDAKLTSQAQVRAYVESALRHGPFADVLLFERQEAPTASANQQAPHQQAAAGSAEQGEPSAGASGLSGKAKRLLEDCEGGDAESCTFLGLSYFSGRDGVKDEARGVAFVERGCDGGHGSACLNLGLRYGIGRGVLRDHGRSLELFRRAAQLLQIGCERRDKWDCAELASIYERGYGVRRDLGRAASLYRKACDLGNEKSCGRLEK